MQQSEHAGVQGKGVGAEGARAEGRKPGANACWRHIRTRCSEGQALGVFLNFKNMDWPNK